MKYFKFRIIGEIIIAQDNFSYISDVVERLQDYGIAIIDNVEMVKNAEDYSKELVDENC